MKIELEDRKNLGQVQQEFSTLFPYLKIEFFSKPHAAGKGSEKKYIRGASELLQDTAVNINGTPLEIFPEMTVAELEGIFESRFGLHVQVFRRSGKLWLETTATDNWTLGYQNQQGRELSSGQLGAPDEPVDYHEQE
ncbi:MAG: hypothetical protein ACK5XV_05695 [Flavobacteriales bacterium]|jgi:hypothetical protein